MPISVLEIKREWGLFYGIFWRGTTFEIILEFDILTSERDSVPVDGVCMRKSKFCDDESSTRDDGNQPNKYCNFPIYATLNCVLLCDDGLPG